MFALELFSDKKKCRSASLGKHIGDETTFLSGERVHSLIIEKKVPLIENPNISELGRD